MQIEELRRRLRALGANPAHEQRVLRHWTQALPLDAGRRRIEHFPANVREVARCRPVYEEWPGWRTSTRGAARFDDLPDAARRYIARLEDATGAPAGILSLGPRRADTLFREMPR